MIKSLTAYLDGMTEKEIEAYFAKRVKQMGGKSYKFRSVTQRGVADRIACMPNGQAWFVELKKPGGRLSALDGVRPEDLNIDGLITRVAAGGIDEVVLAMNATLEGQTTAHYLAERLENYPIRLTQLAHGVPVGGELDHLDDGTLLAALKARRSV